MALQFIDSLTDVVVERKKGQPSNLEIKEAVLLLQGPIVTKRSFKQSAPRRVRGIADVEFEQCLNDLEQQMFGKVAKAHVSRSQNTIVFIKLHPIQISSSQLTQLNSTHPTSPALNSTQLTQHNSLISSQL